MPASRQGSLPGFPSKPRSILALQRAASSVVAMARPRRGAELADRNALSEFGRATVSVYVCVSRDCVCVCVCVCDVYWGWMFSAL